jgi:hypothetical protein
VSIGSERLDAQLLDEPREHLPHERGEARPCEPVVERLVGNRHIVLVVELSQQVGERFDAPTGERRDRRKEQPVWRDLSQPLALPRETAQLVDVIDGKRACERRPHPDKVRGRQRSLRSAGLVTAAWRLSLSPVDPDLTYVATLRHAS